ncbi:MAG: mitochondrial small ribosomal subunit protein uS17m, partial [Endomicrobium sp.]|nr:mitochondrial small ribosomal subunit protein uS17m [Endomicrobium sp.]
MNKKKINMKDQECKVIQQRGKRRIFNGVVISDKNNKTRIVSVIKTYRHTLYKRVLHKNRKFTVHDQNNISHLGDRVTIMAS